MLIVMCPVLPEDSAIFWFSNRTPERLGSPDRVARVKVAPEVTVPDPEGLQGHLTAGPISEARSSLKN